MLAKLKELFFSKNVVETSLPIYDEKNDENFKLINQLELPLGTILKNLALSKKKIEFAYAILHKIISMKKIKPFNKYLVIAVQKYQFIPTREFIEQYAYYYPGFYIEVTPDFPDYIFEYYFPVFRWKYFIKKYNLNKRFFNKKFKKLFVSRAYKSLSENPFIDDVSVLRENESKKKEFYNLVSLKKEYKDAFAIKSFRYITKSMCEELEYTLYPKVLNMLMRQVYGLNEPKIILDETVDRSYYFA